MPLGLWHVCPLHTYPSIQDYCSLIPRPHLGEAVLGLGMRLGTRPGVHNDIHCRVMDIPDCRWSGGFILDTDYSFHISMR